MNESNAGEMMQLLDLELSERELYFIGRIVSASGRFGIRNIYADTSGIESEFSR